MAVVTSVPSTSIRHVATKEDAIEADSLEATPANPLLEVVFDKDHQYFWAASLKRDGHRINVQMCESTWHSDSAAALAYDIYSDSDNYITCFDLKLGSDGRLDSQGTLHHLYIKERRQEKYPWVKPALTKWLNSMDGSRIDVNGQWGEVPRSYVGIPMQDHGSPIYRPGTYGNSDGLRSLDAPIQPLALQQAPPQSWHKKTLVFYGGLGAVVPRFYKEHLEAFRQDYPVKFLAVDLKPKEEGLAIIRERGLPFDDYCPASEFRYSNYSPGNKPVGVVILTRPDSHFPLLDLADSFGVQAFVEKPIVHPRDLQQLMRHYERRQAEMLAIDFFFDNPLVTEAMKLIEQGKLGRLSGLYGEMIESQAVEPGREWLLNPKISGGGQGMDMNVHIEGLAEMILERWGRSLREAEIFPESLVFARYNGAPPGTETYSRVEGTVGPVYFSFAAGKGLHRSAYYLKAKGDLGILEINLGTEKQKGFVKFTPNDGGEVIFIENPTSDIGYRGTVAKILASTDSPKAVSAEERAFRVEATSLSVALMDKAAYMFGNKYYEVELGSDPEHIEVDPTRACTVRERQQQESRDIEALADALQRATSPESGSTVQIDWRLMVSLGKECIGCIIFDVRAREISLDLQSKIDSSDIADLAARVHCVAQLKGWKFIERSESEP